jgi:hypothetical protein
MYEIKKTTQDMKEEFNKDKEKRIKQTRTSGRQNLRA